MNFIISFVISFMILSMIHFMVSFIVSFIISTIYFISSLLDNELEEMRYCMVFHLCCANQGTWYSRTCAAFLYPFVRSVVRYQTPSFSYWRQGLEDMIDHISSVLYCTGLYCTVTYDKDSTCFEDTLHNTLIWLEVIYICHY